MSLADHLVVALAVGLVAFSYYSLWQPGGEADRVLVRAGGEAAQVLSLAQDRTLHVAGQAGESVIEIKDGQARFIDSPCEAKICIHAGWLKQNGDFAACLPNGVSLQLMSVKEQFDTINY